MDQESFRRIHQTTERPLWSYIFNATGNPALADDLCQETYLRILTAKLSGSLTDEHIRHYLFRIASNLVTDYYRGRRRQGDFPAKEPTIKSHEDAIMDQQRLTVAFGNLPAKDRQLLWLALVERLSHREIAAQLSYRETSIRPLLHLAKRRIMELLKGSKNDVR